MNPEAHGHSAIQDIPRLLWTRKYITRISCFVDRASWYDSSKQPTWRTIFSCTFISILCMFQAAMCSSSGELLYQCDTWFMPLCVDDRLVCRLTKHVENRNKHTRKKVCQVICKNHTLPEFTGTRHWTPRIH